MDVERDRERATNERESHSRQAGCVELVVCGRYVYGKRRERSGQARCGCVVVERRAQADRLTAFCCLLESAAGRQAVVELRERSYSYNLNAI